MHLIHYTKYNVKKASNPPAAPKRQNRNTVLPFNCGLKNRNKKNRKKVRTDCK